MKFQPEFSDNKTPLFEYPRPQFKRDSYISLNGEWEYDITPIGEKPNFDGKTIIVPFSPETKASGVERKLLPTETLHYRKTLTVPAVLYEKLERGALFLNIGACDQVCEVYLNGKSLYKHEGGYTPFSVKLDGVVEGDNELYISVIDDASSEVYGRGKQSYERGGIWYTAQSGIWQSAWVEFVPSAFIESIKLYPDVKSMTLTAKVRLYGDYRSIFAKVYDGDSLIFSGEFDSNADIVIDTSACKLWSPDDPELYVLKLIYGEDEVETYFGMRSFGTTIIDGTRYFTLNGEPIFYNGLLDQGYWQDGLYTPPSNKAMYDEISAVKARGFNMLRKHIKIEPYLWYYYCDILGVIVWQDMINGGGKYSKLRINLCPFIDLHINDKNYKKMKRGNELSRKQYMIEAVETIDCLFNVVSIALWTPFNEAWGQFDAAEVCKKLQAHDTTRLFDHASGWQDKGGGDVYSRHIYFRRLRLKSDGKRVLALTEFGGYSLGLSGHVFTPKKFGYKSFNDVFSFKKAYEKLYLDEVISNVKSAGLCATVYTQLTDVEDEINGIFTFDRYPKADENFFHEINGKVYSAFFERVDKIK